MEKENTDLGKKFRLVTIIGFVALCILAYSFVIGPFLAVRDEGAPYVSLIEVSVNATVNSTVIHLEDEDFANMGVDVKQENGIIFIYFRPSGIHPLDFNYMYGSRVGDPSSRKYLEYKGVYYYGVLAIP